MKKGTLRELAVLFKLQNNLFALLNFRCLARCVMVQ